MKELTIEQKAQAYDEAIDGIQEILSSGEDSIKMSRLQLRLQGIFPELKEGKESKDEKIRKVIRGWIYTRPASFFDNGISKEEILAWLEKQGEQKSADKVEPKFHEGDWVVYEENTYQIHNISLKKYYECLRTDGTVHIFDFEYIDSKSHLWTIQDAKDGDVLVKNMYPTGPDICIFKEFIRQTFTMKVYCSINNKGQFLHNHDAYYHRYDVSLYPATKEQRDALMKAMSDAGWEFDFNKKELKKIESKNIEGTFINVDEVRENFVKEVYRVLADDTTNDRANDIIYYFDSLPTIYLHTNKPLPSDYDDFDIFKNHAWSEEDEERFVKIIEATKSRYDAVTGAFLIKWLKSLRPQNRWKPSEEQLETFEYYLNADISNKDREVLFDLYNQLKQL